MKYVEELSFGDCFLLDNEMYLLTSDFKSNGNKLCYSLNNGQPKWVKSDAIVDLSPIYRLDKDNNIIPFKQYNDDTKSINIH